MTSPSPTRFYPPSNHDQFLIVATPHEHYCEFRCYACLGFEADSKGEYTIPLYERDEDGPSPEAISDFAQAAVYLSGSIKWDGCANLQFDEQERCMLHFCGREDARKVGKLIDRLYDLAAELFPKWDAGGAE
jgi:hypothetical protein